MATTTWLPYLDGSGRSKMLRRMTLKNLAVCRKTELDSITNASLIERYDPTVVPEGTVLEEPGLLASASP
jgi:hypothetical protein